MTNDIALIALASVFILDRLFSAFRGRGIDLTKLCDQVDRIHTDVWKIKDENHKLLVMHDNKDEDGVYKWWVRASLERAIERQAIATEQLNKVLLEIHNEQMNQRVMLQELKR